MSETTIDRGQVSTSAAEVYAAQFVPALFEEWVSPVADATGIRAEDVVLDVACGTGVLTREVARRTGGTVVGLDVNAGMLQVGRSRAPEIVWREASAENIPFPDHHFDAVVSQFGLMFFADRVAALREMNRVLQPDGRMAVAVWDTLENCTGYLHFSKLLERLFGTKVAQSLHAPFNLGDTMLLHDLYTQAGMLDVEIETRGGFGRFSSVKEWVTVEIKGWVLAETLDDDAFANLLNEAETSLSAFVQPDGTVAFPMSAHIVTATGRR